MEKDFLQEHGVIRGNSFKLKESRSRLGIREKFSQCEVLEHVAQRGYGCLVLDSDVTLQGPKTCLTQLCSLGADQHRLNQINENRKRLNKRAALWL